MSRVSRAITKLFVGGDNENLDLGVGGGDHDILAALGVCSSSMVTPRYPKYSEMALRALFGVLADACG